MIILLALLSLCQIVNGQDDYFWAVARTWPIPMPVTNVSTILPTLFLQQCQFDLPCKQVDDKVEMYNQTSFDWVGTLCISHNSSATLPDCLLLDRKEVVSWLDPLKGISQSWMIGSILSALGQVTNGISFGSDTSGNCSGLNVTTYSLNMTLSFPFFSSSSQNSSKDNYTLSLPRCRGNLEFQWPPNFVTCIPRQDSPKSKIPGWWLWKDFPVKKQGLPKRLFTSPWIYSNAAGGLVDLSPFALFNSSRWVLSNNTGHLNNSRLKIFESNKIDNFTKGKHPVCVDPPHLWILSNLSEGRRLDCNVTKCLLSQCWSFEHKTAILAKMPTQVWLPVKADPKDFPVMSLLRTKRDFGITAAIVTAIAISAAAAVTAGVAMANQVQTVNTINEVTQKTSEALMQQEAINAHLASGILLLNKRVDLVEEEVYKLFDVIAMSCVYRKEHLCVTSYYASLNESMALSNFLKGNWSIGFEQLQRNLTLKILSLNATKAEFITIGQFSDWMVATFAYIKEWAGVGVLGMLMCAGLLVALLLIVKVMRARQREKVAIMRAFAALEAGASPQAWLSMLKEA